MDLRQSIYDYPGKVLWSRMTLRPDGTMTGASRDPRLGARAPAVLRHALLPHARRPRPHRSRARAGALSTASRAPGDGAADTDAVAGRGLIGAVDFGTLATPLVVEVALSSVSEDGALANLRAEAPDFDFDRMHAAARTAWAAGARLRWTSPPPRRCARSAGDGALPRAAGAQPVDGRGRTLPRPGRRGAPGATASTSCPPSRCGTPIAPSSR